nr:unnamed protein product [Callosobruchus chinensis]
MYTFKVMSTITENDWIVSKKAKGIQRSALKEITFDDYYKCLMDRRQVEIQQNFITTSKHNVYTASQKKVALSPYDDKRMEEPAAKKAKQRIVPSPVNTKTPPDQKVFFCFCEESMRRNKTDRLIPPEELFTSPINLFCYSSHDLQGFRYGSTFICKEIAILNVASGTYKHKMLNIPHQFEWLEKKVQYQMG